MAETSGLSAPNWNRNSPSIRRILADVRELQRDPSDQYAARPLDDNMFDWHFVIRGPVGTDFEGGVYHGRIILPNDYPFKPPSIMILTENGRWEVNTKICLSISAYHPEDWQPAWGIRTILEALISFMTTPGEGAVGALDYSSQERQRLATESQSYTHPLMPVLPPLSSEPRTGPNKYQDEIAKMHIVSLENSSKIGTQSPDTSNPTLESTESSTSLEPTDAQNGSVVDSAIISEVAQESAMPVAAPDATRQDRPLGLDTRHSSAQESEPTQTYQSDHGGPTSGAGETPVSDQEGRGVRRRGAPEANSTGGAAAAAIQSGQIGTNRTRTGVNETGDEPHTDWLLYYAIALAVVIFVILYRKALLAFREQF
mmetsp:Transcript_1067/g.2589  ORF Transcript_1067/g.2589 Transcript_1067/m.2589 type:complete len:370 (+) Transcript_1067:145-1254(+)